MYDRHAIINEIFSQVTALKKIKQNMIIKFDFTIGTDAEWAKRLSDGTSSGVTERVLGPPLQKQNIQVLPIHVNLPRAIKVKHLSFIPIHRPHNDPSTNHPLILQAAHVRCQNKLFPIQAPHHRMSSNKTKIPDFRCLVQQKREKLKRIENADDFRFIVDNPSNDPRDNSLQPLAKHDLRYLQQLIMRTRHNTLTISLSQVTLSDEWINNPGDCCANAVILGKTMLNFKFKVSGSVVLVRVEVETDSLLIVGFLEDGQQGRSHQIERFIFIA
ncbi:hypothetical protein TNCV_103871 [Trichonephila clavipes]|nr:hypothetical protein TNCV_103871 [Trichonephila clavipes]